MLATFAIIGWSNLCRAAEWWQPTVPLCPMDHCDDSEYDTTPVPRVFRGTYRHGFETSDFTPDGSKCRWWMSGEIRPVVDALLHTGPHLIATATVEVEGTLTPPGCYGHLGAARRELKVTKINSFKVTAVVPIPTLVRGQ